jgi:hypothetical protein
VAITGAGAAGAVYYGVIGAVTNSTTAVMDGDYSTAGTTVSGAAMTIVERYTGHSPQLVGTHRNGSGHNRSDGGLAHFLTTCPSLSHCTTPRRHPLAI